MDIQSNLVYLLRDYYTSWPAKYELLPERMQQIYDNYLFFADQFHSNMPFIETIFPFPELSGLNAGPVIRKWIGAYCAVLLLRQYTLQKQFVYDDPLGYPLIPPSQRGKRRWLDEIGHFRKLLEEVLDNKELLDTLNFGFFKDDWSTKHSVPTPLAFIDTFKSMLADGLESGAITQPVSPVKRQEFINASQRIVEKVLDDYWVLNNGLPVDEHTKNWYISGGRIVFNKDAFSDDPDTHYSGVESFLGSGAADSIITGISSTFLYARNKTYLLSQEDFFRGIDKLELTHEHIIVSFGFSLYYYIESLKVKGLEADHYNNNKIFSFPGNRLLHNCMFIFKKDALRSLTTLDVNKEQQDKFSLRKISEKFNLYASVISLHEAPPEFRLEVGEGKKSEELDKSVLLTLAFSLQVAWQQNSTVVQFIEYSEYRQNGLPDNIDTVQSITSTS